MKSMIKMRLSICIPTYNRGQFLPATLDSIISQIDDDARSRVEICISDNASDDNTEELVAGYRERHPQIVYHRWAINMGADLNYLKVVEISSGDYCWLFGSDDVMSQGAINRALFEIDSNPDVILYERAESDHDLAAIPVLRNWTSLNNNYDFNTTTERERFLEYLASCNSFGGLFSYLSVILFRKSRWQEIGDKGRFAGSAYVHLHVLLEILKSGAKFHYRHEVAVICRTGNDSFLSEDSIAGNYKRIRLDLVGYREIPGYVFGCDSEEYHLIRKMVGRNLPLSGLIKYKLAFIAMGDAKASRRIELMLLANGFALKYLFTRLAGVWPISTILLCCSRVSRMIRKSMSGVKK